MPTLIQLINADRDLSLFSRGIRVSGLEKTLNKKGPFTLLVPVNMALASLSVPVYMQFLQPQNNTELVALLSGFILAGKNLFQDFYQDQQLTTLDGQKVIVNIRNGNVYVNTSKIMAADRQAVNGVVHVLGNTFTA